MPASISVRDNIDCAFYATGDGFCLPFQDFLGDTESLILIRQSCTLVIKKSGYEPNLRLPSPQSQRH